MRNEYFIEKRRLPVEIELVTGERVAGDLFIQASWRGPSVLEDAPEFMNSGDAFFPLQLADGSTRLLSKRHVTVLRCPASEARMPSETIGDPASVSLELRNGSVITGTLMIEALAPNARVLDYLNRSTESFVTLFDDSGDVLVSREQIVSVVNLDDGAD